MDIKNGNDLGSVEIFFSLIGGTYAEDGRLQGLLDMIGAAYVGSGVIGSVLGMDKVIMKQVLRQNGILVADFIGIKKYEVNDETVHQVEKKLAYPIFIKPANLGSSIGITKAYNQKDLLRGMNLAFEYDNKIILEQYIKGREIECAVLGNDNLLTISIPGEIAAKEDYYDYNSKYVNEMGVKILIPAPLNDNQTMQAQLLAKRVYEILDCSCFGRVDLFLTANNKWYANEINTIPGFTHMSMYPKLMELSGIPYSKLIDKLILLALEKKKNIDTLKIEVD